MKGDKQKIQELEQTVKRLARELARLIARDAAPKPPRVGTWVVKPNSTQAKGTTAVTCTVYSSGVTTGLTISAIPLGATVTSGKWCTAWLDPSGKWYVFPWEC